MLSSSKEILAKSSGKERVQLNPRTELSPSKPQSSSSSTSFSKLLVVGGVAAAGAAGFLAWRWYQSHREKQETEHMFSDEACNNARSATAQYNKQPVEVVYEKDLKLKQRNGHSVSKITEVGPEEDEWETDEEDRLLREKEGEAVVGAMESDDLLEAQAAKYMEQDLRRQWKRLIKKRQDYLSKGQTPPANLDTKLTRISQELDEIRDWRSEQLRSHGVAADAAGQPPRRGFGLPMAVGDDDEEYEDEEDDLDGGWGGGYAARGGGRAKKPRYHTGMDSDGEETEEVEDWEDDDGEEMDWGGNDDGYDDYDDPYAHYGYQDDDEGTFPGDPNAKLSPEQQTRLVEALMAALEAHERGGGPGSAREGGDDGEVAAAERAYFNARRQQPPLSSTAAAASAYGPGAGRGRGATQPRPASGIEELDDEEDPAGDIMAQYEFKHRQRFGMTTETTTKTTTTTTTKSTVVEVVEEGVEGDDDGFQTASDDEEDATLAQQQKNKKGSKGKKSADGKGRKPRVVEV